MSNKTIITGFLVALAAIFAIKYVKDRQKSTRKNTSVAEMIKLSSPEIVVTVSKVEECFVGDLDLLLGDVKKEWLSQDVLALTIEPIDKSVSKFKSLSTRLRPTQLIAGVKHKFPLKSISPQGEALGVFLCLDRERTNSCRNKRAHTYQELTKDGFQGKGAKLRHKDKMFFFQYLFKSKDTVYFGNDNIKTYEQYEAFIRKTLQIGGYTQKAASAVTTQVVGIQKILSNYAVAKKTDNQSYTMDVQLVKHAGDVCNRSGQDFRTRSKQRKEKDIPSHFKRISK